MKKLWFHIVKTTILIRKKLPVFIVPSKSMMKNLGGCNMTNKQAMETLATLRFMISSGLMKVTQENAEFMFTLVVALDVGIAAINEIDQKQGEQK